MRPWLICVLALACGKGEEDSGPTETDAPTTSTSPATTSSSAATSSAMSTTTQSTSSTTPVVVTTTTSRQTTTSTHPTTTSKHTTTVPTTTSTSPASTTTVPAWEPPKGCAYWETLRTVLLCDGDWTPMLHFANPQGSAQCPDYYTMGGNAYPSMDVAFAANDCDNGCVYSASVAVMLTYCGVRGEYMVWVSGAPGEVAHPGQCDDVYEFYTKFGSGWYESYKDFAKQNPCP